MAAENAVDVTESFQPFRMGIHNQQEDVAFEPAQQSLHVASTKACSATPMGAVELSSMLADLLGSQSNAILLILYFHPALATKQTSELNSSYMTPPDDHCATLRGSVFDIGGVQSHDFPTINNHHAQTTLCF